MSKRTPLVALMLMSACGGAEMPDADSHDDSPALRGMIRRVAHLIHVSDAKDAG